MGVTQLWQILAPVQQHRPLSSLAGLTLAVDLSIWVCETQCVKQMQGVVSKPFLRNLFFRISHLTKLGVKLVFVVEGTAPELKWEAMMKRQQVRFPGRQGKQPQHRQGRRNFNSCLRECCELLDILGIPYVQSHGEAEAMCAVLNAAGLVDGCLTNDGDAFLYGATVVYRNFTMNTKDPHVESYRMSDIQTELGIDRDGLVALALLLGCDYIPKGVPGVGPANAVKLLQTLRGRNVLKRLREWRTISEPHCLDQVEVLMRRKAVSVSDFPQEKVIKEFLVSKDKCPRVLPSWKRPIINRLQDFALDKLEWPVEYGLEKILPLVTLWDMRDITQSKHGSRSLHLKPHRIVKSRVRQGVPCYEIEWNKPVSDTTCPDDYYTTIEEQELFSQCYPQIVDEFNVTQEEKKAKKSSKGSKKKKKDKDQKQKPTDEAEPEMSTAASSCPIADELTHSFASLKVDDIRAETENVRTSKAGSDPQKTKVPKGGKRKKGENEKVAKTITGAEGHVEKPCFAEALEYNGYESKVEVRKDTYNGDKGDPLVRENDAEELDDSNNDSFVPLSMRVKKKLQKKNAVDEFDMLVLSSDQNDIPFIIENASGMPTSEKTELESVSRTESVSHPSFNDSYAFSINLDNIDTVGQLCDVSDNQNKVLDDSIIRIENNLEDMKNDIHIGCTPRASVNECNSDTPLSLQKQFINDRFNTKVSSPLVEDFSSPVTYIKQNSNHDDKSHSFIEIWDTPDIRKPAILISDDTDSMNMVVSIPFEENTDKMEISEMDKSQFKDLGSDGKISVEDKRLDLGNKLVTTPLYSVNRCAQNTLQTVASPLYLLCKSKLNISEMSLLDKPDFNVQTSLLNSLCKTLNITSSPVNYNYDKNLVAEDNTDVSFHDMASPAMNSESDKSVYDLENVSNSWKKVYDYDNLSMIEEDVLTASFAQEMANETNLIDKQTNLKDKQVEYVFESDKRKTTNVKVLDHNIPIPANYNKESVTDNEVSKDDMELDSSDSYSSQNSNISVEKVKGLDMVVKDNFHNAASSDIHGTKAPDRPVLEDITNRKNSQNENEGRLEEISASQKQKKGKTKGIRKGKKKEVRKVSAVMDLSHDSDDSFILSQMIPSQKEMISSEKRMILSQKLTLPDKTEQTPASALQILHENEDPPSMLCEETSPIQEADKENIATISQSAKEIESGRAVGKAKRMSTEVEKKYTAELLTSVCSKVVSSNTKYNRTYSIDKVDAMKCGPPLNVPSNENVTSDELSNNCVVERVRLKRIDDAPERIDKMHKKTESPALSEANFSMKLKPLQAKCHATLDTTVAASSPVSLADRLKRRLKNSSTRQVLTDFTK